MDTLPSNVLLNIYIKVSFLTFNMFQYFFVLCSRSLSDHSKVIRNHKFISALKYSIGLLWQTVTLASRKDRVYGLSCVPIHLRYTLVHNLSGLVLPTKPTVLKAIGKFHSNIMHAKQIYIPFHSLLKKDYPSENLMEMELLFRIIRRTTGEHCIYVLKVCVILNSKPKVFTLNKDKHIQQFLTCRCIAMSNNQGDKKVLSPA